MWHLTELMSSLVTNRWIIKLSKNIFYPLIFLLAVIQNKHVLIPVS
jgi:hypothetical protein